jgi:hypothetical protein
LYFIMPILIVVEQIIIEASPVHVWESLVRTEDYPFWNPYLCEAEGEIKLNNHVCFSVRPPGRRRLRFNFKIEHLAAQKDLRLIYHPYVTGLLDRDWNMHLEAIGPHRTRFTQRVLFRGRLVPHYELKLQPATRAGLQEMNAALKQRAEHRRRSLPETMSVSFLKSAISSG